MTIIFYKYQGTGNDFIIVDNRLQIINKNDTKRIAELCDRRFGIGADGFILLEHAEDADFKMVYYNSDGNESSMCGNGGRCIVAFAKCLGIVNDKADFIAIDGLHKAEIKKGVVHLQMQDVSEVIAYDNHLFLDTGSPHHVTMVSNLQSYDVKNNGSKIRYGAPYKEKGSNVNFVEHINDNSFAVRTYERGVEDETLSCGTGVTAVALAMHKKGLTQHEQVVLKTQGGELQIKFKSLNSGYTDIWLIGPAEKVFKGEVKW